MRDELREKIDGLARRAGLRGVPPALVIAAACCLACAVIIGVWHWWPRDGGGVVISEATPGAVADAAGTKAAEEPSGTIWVHVVGAVAVPGVYEVPAGSRVTAAIDAAGGLRPDAAQAAVNLAASLSDGEQVKVPTLLEYSSGGGGASGTTSGTAKNAPVNINTADATLLDTLPGIGPSTAQKIIDDREANGPFKSVEDLGRVSGFGDKKLAQLKGLICVR